MSLTGRFLYGVLILGSWTNWREFIVCHKSIHLTVYTSMVTYRLHLVRAQPMVSQQNPVCESEVHQVGICVRVSVFVCV